MAEIADIIGAQDSAIEALAVDKGLDPAAYENKDALAGALSPLVTPEEIAALPRNDETVDSDVENDSEPSNDDTAENAGGDGSSDDDGAQDSATDAADDADKPRTVFVRLHRGYPLTQPHRRAGITLTPGPEPVEVPVDDEILASLEADRYVEIVDAAEAEKWATHHAAINGDPETEPIPSVAPTEVYDDPSNVGAGQPSGRRYDTGVNGGADPTSENPDGSIQMPRETRKPAAPTATRELKKHADVVKRATELGIAPVVAVKGDLLRAAIKTAETDGVDVANAELADAIAAAKKDK